VPLVRDGRATSAILLPKNADPALRKLAASFAATVRRSTGAEIPLLAREEAAALPPGHTRVYLGPGPEAETAGLRLEEIPEEGYRLVVQEGAVFVLGRDTDSSQPTRWALNRILEEQLGVRWLWPGELGTYVPRHANLELPLADLRYQPQLSLRRLRISANSPISTDDPVLNERLLREAKEWAANHQSGNRSQARFGHAFVHWWEKYGKAHPDYFAEPPPDTENPALKHPDRVKLRLSNPAVIEQIAAEYREAGSPPYWNVCPNDGGGFDLSEATRAWDIPQGQSPDDIWSARANLTPRFVEFWNRLHRRLAESNPEVRLSTYAYYAYKIPPPAERPLTATTAIGIVPGYKDQELWEGWAAQPGVAELYLRPNWGHIGANAPYLPLRDMARFLNFTRKHKMAGFDLDSIVGFWSTQGLNYYLWARALSQPEVSVEAVIEEYCSAFGAGASHIRAYFDHWLRLTDDYAYPETYALHDPEAEHGRFMKLVREGKTEVNFVRGPRYALPYLYTDAVLQPGEELLDKARAAIGEGDAEAAARVEFLRAGLEELRATRDLIALARSLGPRPTPAQLDALRQKDEALEAIRTRHTAGHAVWGARLTLYENRYRVPIRPKTLPLPSLNLDGL